MHHEENWRLTEGVLKLLLKYRFPVFIGTKTKLILRDIELLKQIDRNAIIPRDLKEHLHHGVIASISVSTMNETISNMLEPGAELPLERFKVLKQLKEEGLLVGVNAMPLLPFISDTDEEIEKIIAAAKENGADYILIAGLTLFGKERADSRTLYFNFLQRYDASLIAEYEKLYGANSFPSYFYQQQLKKRADALCKKHNIRTSILHADVKTIKRNTIDPQGKLF